MPMVYWVSTEAPTLLLGICLPAMLPLGRHVLSEYLSPMASYVSSALSSRGSHSELRSGSGDFGSSMDTPLKDHHYRSAGSKPSEPQSDLQTYVTDRPSAESCEEMSSPTEPTLRRPQQGPYHYTCTARVSNPHAASDPAGVMVPPQAIWVENGITVHHQNRRL